MQITLDLKSLFLLSLYSYESGILEDPNTHAPKDLYEMTASPQNTPDEPTIVDIEFKNGELLTDLQICSSVSNMKENS